MGTIDLTVFSKPWPDLSISELATFIKNLGFKGVELPVRPGFQVTPETVEKGLPEAVRIFSDNGVKIGSVAGPMDEKTIAACGESGVPLLRIMVAIDMEIGYFATEKTVRDTFDSLLPALKSHGVTIGVQNHCAQMIGSSIGLMHLIEQYDPKCIGAVLDPAHCGLDGEPDTMAIDIAWSHLVMLNLKSAYWKRAGADETGAAKWRPFWCTGKEGITSWPVVAAELKKRGFSGDVCLTAEYSNPNERGDLTGSAVEPLVKGDLQYAKSLFE